MAITPSAPEAAAAALALPTIESLFIAESTFRFVPAHPGQPVSVEEMVMEIVAEGTREQPNLRVVALTGELVREKNPHCPYELKVTAVAIVRFPAVPEGADPDQLTQHAGLLLAPTLMSTVREHVIALTARCDAPKMILPLYAMSEIRQMLKVRPLT